MSGGIAYVYDPNAKLAALANGDVKDDIAPVTAADTSDVQLLRALVQRHLKFTGSDVARRLLMSWDKTMASGAFKKVFPREYRR